MAAPEHERTPSTSDTRDRDGLRGGDAVGPLLSMHAALVLMTSAFIGVVVGGLTYLSTSDAAAALTAGLVLQQHFDVFPVQGRFG
ncbi:hypothetical protein [Streptomyces sp. WMMC940]|uniref:hypothetical protein n=1 Tax=Streptomyces sp. WMMC940 TaxID=3015153 RepID=UPI0022B70940|nr:hypothetical protein [Streptomyces sp. WMMC940]MCZ7460575.1 hypothetical protein [Streptomyces sp. WMMC940]